LRSVRGDPQQKDRRCFATIELVRADEDRDTCGVAGIPGGLDQATGVLAAGDAAGGAKTDDAASICAVTSCFPSDASARDGVTLLGLLQIAVRFVRRRACHQNKTK
jgi:hypothetical protein